MLWCLVPVQGLLLREPLLDAAALLRSVRPGEPTALHSLETALAAAARQPTELLNKVTADVMSTIGSLA